MNGPFYAAKDNPSKAAALSGTSRTLLLSGAGADTLVGGSDETIMFGGGGANLFGLATGTQPILPVPATKGLKNASPPLQLPPFCGAAR